MPPRFFVDTALAPGQSLSLPAQAARHVQVLRMQPGQSVVLFNGQAEPTCGAAEGEFIATIEQMGRRDVQVTVGAYVPTARELPGAVHLVLGVPANERMDWLVEKATELGVASIQALMTVRSVLRLKEDRADKKQAHWRAVAAAACEQSGRNCLPQIHPVLTWRDWLAAAADQQAAKRYVLSLDAAARPLAQTVMHSANQTANTWHFLSGPEGGLSPAEEKAAINAGWQPVRLGVRTLRAETAPLACLAWLGACLEAEGTSHSSHL